MIIFSAPSRGQQVLTPLGVEQTTSLLVVLIVGPLGGAGLDRRRLAPARWVPARSRAGIQAFSRESPDAKSRGGMPPAPLF